MKEERKWSNAKPQNLYAEVAKATYKAGLQISKKSKKEQDTLILDMNLLNQADNHCMALIKKHAGKPYVQNLYQLIGTYQRIWPVLQRDLERDRKETMRKLYVTSKVFDKAKGKALDRAREIKHEQKQKKWRKRRKAR